MKYQIYSCYRAQKVFREVPLYKMVQFLLLRKPTGSYLQSAALGMSLYLSIARTMGRGSTTQKSVAVVGHNPKILFGRPPRKSIHLASGHPASGVPQQSTPIVGREHRALAINDTRTNTEAVPVVHGGICSGLCAL